MTHAETRHRKGLYCSDCTCPDCEAQRNAILLGNDASRAVAGRECNSVEDYDEANARGEYPTARIVRIGQSHHDIKLV